MLDPLEQTKLKKNLFILRVLFGGMLVAKPIYLAMGIFIKTRLALPISLAPEALPMLRNWLILASLVLVVISLFLRQRLLKGLSPRQLQKAERQTDPQRGLHPVTPPYQTSMIISLSLVDAIGIFGFVLFLLGDSTACFYSFIAVSTLASIHFRPRLRDLERLASLLQGKVDSTLPKGLL